MLELLELRHALVVVEPLGLHPRDLAVLQLVELPAQDELRVLEDRLDERQQVERVRLGRRVEERDRLEQVERERLVHREVVLQLDVDAKGEARARLLVRDDLDDAAVDERAEQLPGPLEVRLLRPLRLVRVADQALHRPPAVAPAREHVQEHAVRHLEARRQPLGRRAHQPLEGREVPVGEVVLRRPPLDDLLSVLRLLAQAQVLDHVLRGLRHDIAEVVEALPPGAAGDLVEVARGEDRGLLPVELAQTRKEHRADRHVDADAERVGAADDLEQPLLRELLGEHAVLRQQARVVQADPLLQPLADVGAVRAREAEARDLGGDGVLLLARRTRSGW